jgi:hypothetical protein
MLRRLVVLIVGLAIVVSMPSRNFAQTTYGPVIEIEGDHFTVNGVSKFLIFVSYFDALRASTSVRDSDLSWLSSHGISGVRIFTNWHHWCAGGAVNDGVIAPDGSLNEARLTVLTNFLTAASQRGLLVDLTFDNELGTAALSLGQYKAAVAALSNRLANFKNVIFDVENEYQLKDIDGHDFSDADVAAVLQVVRQPAGDPTRRLTASPPDSVTGIASGTSSRVTGMDFNTYHDPRDPGVWFTDGRINQVLNDLRSGLNPSIKPIYLQEPMPFDAGPSCQPKTFDSDMSHATSAITASKTHGAAAWTFHNRAAFDMPSQISLYGGLSSAERTEIEALAGFADGVCWGANAASISPQSGSVPAAGGAGGSFAISLNGACQASWTVSSDASWLTATPLTGNGAGSVQYSASAVNTSGATRVGHLTVRGRTFTVTQPAATFASADFNGDSDTDLVWQHASTGATAVWLMNNGGNTPTEISGQSFTPPVPSPWKIVGTGDANHDGHTDLFLQNDSGSTTSVSVWHMSGTVQLNGDAIAGPSVPSTWKVRAVGDFNGDGDLDLVWQNTTGGSLAVWYLHDFVYVDGVSVSPSVVADTNWHIVGAADVNGDGKTDLFWHHRTHGDLALWYMDGITQVSGVSLTPAMVADVNWQVVGVGDFNRDGKPDLIWQHTDGSIATWRMNGTVQVSGVAFSPSTPGDPLWRIVGPR